MDKKWFGIFVLFGFAWHAQAQDKLMIEKFIGEWKICRTSTLDSLRFCHMSCRFLADGIYELPNIHSRACLKCLTEIITLSGHWYLTGDTICIETVHEGRIYTHRIVNLMLGDENNFSGIEEWPFVPTYGFEENPKPKTYFSRLR